MPPEDLQKNERPHWIAMLATLVCVVALLYAGAHYFWLKNKPSAISAFNPDRQVVPPNARPLKVDQALASLGLPKPLPFFEKENVVQSLGFGLNAPSSIASSSPPRPPETYVGYRIVGQSTSTVREAYRSYFQGMGWKEAGGSKNNSALVFISPDTRRQASIQLFEIGSGPDTQEKTIVVAFSMLTFPAVSPNINPRLIKQ